jgi:predicted MFS family arabinose efflux permease
LAARQPDTAEGGVAGFWARLTSGNRPTLLVLSAALAVDYADRSVVGALGPQLKAYFHLGNTGLGLLASTFAVVGSISTLPAGALVDRVNRVRMLRVALLLWAIAMVAAGGAVALWMLIAARVALGALTAVARPAAASLIGDLFRPARRNRALAVVDAGELVGTGVGLGVAAFAGTLLHWRSVFWILAALGAALMFGARWIEEPRRRDHHDGGRRSFREAVREVLHTRTVLIVILAGSVGYFFFAGVRTFAVTFTVRRYGVSTSVADLLLLLVGVGAAVGILVGGRVGDRLSESSRHGARLVFAAGAFVGAVVLYLGGLLIPSLPLAMPLYVAGSASLSSASPVLDAIRIDVISPDVWGRAESVRTLSQIVFEAIAPLGFGAVADTFGGGGRGLQLAFLLALPLLLGNGLILLLARGPLEEERRD